jgi:hypothetical protein
MKTPARFDCGDTYRSARTRDLQPASLPLTSRRLANALADHVESTEHTL